MSILQRKAQAKNNVPNALYSLAGHLIDLNESIALYLETNLGFDIDPHHMRQAPRFLGSDGFDDQMDGLSGLLFAIGEKGVVGGNTQNQSDCQMLIEISPKLAQSMIATKLGGQTKKKEKSDTSFTLFDVLIIRPLAEQILSQVRSLGAAQTADIIGRHFSMNGLSAVKFAKQENWIALNFPVRLKMERDAKSKTDGKGKDPLGISFYLSHLAAQNLLQSAQEKLNHKIIDPDDPWAQHMRGTMQSATRTLEIVIEDLKLSIAECTRLELGQIIALPGASHERLNIKTNGPHGKSVLTTATLGVFKSSKAVKLNADIDPDFIGENKRARP